MIEKNAIREALDKYGIKMSEFARAEEIPLRTFHNWCYGERKPAPYLERWCIEKIKSYEITKEMLELLKETIYVLEVARFDSTQDSDDGDNLYDKIKEFLKKKAAE